MVNFEPPPNVIRQVTPLGLCTGVSAVVFIILCYHFYYTFVQSAEC